MQINTHTIFTCKRGEAHVNGKKTGIHHQAIQFETSPLNWYKVNYVKIIIKNTFNQYKTYWRQSTQSISDEILLCSLKNYFWTML